jgi:hypothetical protein
VDLRIIPLTVEPSVEVVPMPELSEHVQACVVDEREKLLIRPHGFDGPQLMGIAVDADKVLVAHGVYSMYRAHIALGPDRSPWLGPLGVGLILDDGAGRELWTKRSEHVAFPGHWMYAVGGGSATTGSAIDTILAETREELGVHAEDLVGLRPVALLAGHNYGVYTVFRATLRKGATINPDPREVAETRWVEAPLEELAPVQPLVPEVWKAVRAIESGRSCAGVSALACQRTPDG